MEFFSIIRIALFEKYSALIVESDRDSSSSNALIIA